MKRFYECTFIVNPGLDDPQIEGTVKMAEDTIVKNGGEIVRTEHLGRRRLAYPITKKHNGYYVCIEFESEQHIVDKIERFLTLDENVMRYLTLALDARELKAKRDRAVLLQQESEQKEAAQSTPDRPAERKPADTPKEETKAAAAESSETAGKKEDTEKASEATEVKKEETEVKKEETEVKKEEAEVAAPSTESATTETAEDDAVVETAEDTNASETEERDEEAEKTAG
jgi:small subunit ribosomal protein S6